MIITRKSIMHSIKFSSPATSLKLFHMAAFALMLSSVGCVKQIWNASDLTDWVKDRATEQGCDRNTIVLKEWYEKGADGNEWHGNCVDSKTGKRKDFLINVDSVWKPSAED
jgi:hypothetical protein